MPRHLHLVPAGADLLDEDDGVAIEAETTNLVDLDTERLRRRYRYHPSAGRAWLEDLFDEDDFDPVC